MRRAATQRWIPARPLFVQGPQRPAAPGDARENRPHFSRPPTARPPADSIPSRHRTPRSETPRGVPAPASAPHRTGQRFDATAQEFLWPPREPFIIFTALSSGRLPPQLLVEKRPGPLPIPLGGCDRYLQDLGRFFDRNACEETQVDQPGRPRVQSLQP